MKDTEYDPTQDNPSDSPSSDSRRDFLKSRIVHADPITLNLQVCAYSSSLSIVSRPTKMSAGYRACCVRYVGQLRPKFQQRGSETGYLREKMVCGRINDRFVNVNSARATIIKGSAEIWNLINPSGGWSQPIHLHLEEGIILDKFVSGTRVPIPVHERGRKDVFVLGPNTRLRVFIRLRDFTGKYVMHCHNIIHEAHTMMVRFDVRED